MYTFIKITLLIAAVFLMKPTALGQEYMVLSMIISIVALCMHFLEILKYKDGNVTIKNFIVLIASLILWSYLVVHALLVGSNGLDNVIKAALSHVIIVFIFTIILSRQKDNQLFFKWFIKILAFLSWSFLITFVLSLFIDINSLFLFEIPIATYNHSQLFYFPFTSLSSFMIVEGMELPRFLGTFREPGILQAFLIWAYFNLKQYNLHTKKMKLILIVGIVGTFSTAGIAIFLGTIAVSYFFNKKVFKGVALIALCVIALNYAPYIGLQYKTVTHGESISARSEATLTGLEKLLDNPIGTGMYNRGMFDLELSGINLLASSYMIGAIGVLMVLMVYFLPLYKYRYKAIYLIGITPLLVTLLYSQPIIDAPLVYVLLLANYGKGLEMTSPIVEKDKVRVKKRRFKKYRLTW